MIDQQDIIGMSDMDMQTFAMESGANEIRDVENQLEQLLEEVKAERIFRESNRED